MAAEFHINEEEVSDVIAGGYQALAFLCDQYLDTYFGYKSSDKKSDRIVTLYMLLRVVQDNQNNTDVSTDETFQEAINCLYAEMSTIPYQTRIS